MMTLKTKKLQGEITLNGSKSISNRILMIQAILGEEFPILGLSNAKDTTTLKGLLSKLHEPILDAGEAGTAYRFMTAYLAWKGNNQVLMGTKRMCERPIGVLADALNGLGAQIHYLGKKGYPPLQMKTHEIDGWKQRVCMGADVSSQFISALLLIAPVLPKGIELILEGKVISRPYIQMTLNLMEEFGILALWHNDMIKVPPQKYQPKSFRVEADWSAASYYYSLVALSDSAQLQLNGLQEKSVQGDAVIVDIMKQFGVKTTFNKKGILLTKEPTEITHFKYDCSDCPDIAQTLAVMCAALEVNALLTGLETLTIKETDRIHAVKVELEKLGCEIETTANSLWVKKGITNKNQAARVGTYDDHRMAMAFAPLALVLNQVKMEDKQVVNKSYPKFWDDFNYLGLTNY
ncbi:3-phosphoshikimate 1-carboxyvinyltransferase [Aureispira anguillae]|uniref:3-phosphoshikimate 1-carboxyvinyltransferase n=1 Tax=Aureispira anguillae TaxID=2864201 RepID=A0A915YJR3_9BACT|nr:3-phosphoshikimate 1-carboxyvinyltransferase [Aureispira anguillae]BDS14492.1 3-phosphoshikimate 1-carboxyvinyltransferase [Aureispira anguillae]